VYLSPPHLGSLEAKYVSEALESNWIAPTGPQVDAFEREFADYVRAPHSLALNSGTAALHVALRLLGVAAGDEVIVSTLTFAASVNPIRYLNANPVFVDSERASWNMDPGLLADALERRVKTGRLPRAVVVVHLYGQAADLRRLLSVCESCAVPVIEDAAEALGATCDNNAAGTFGRCGFYSFNGNKIITTSAGGMLVSRDVDFIARAKKLAAQARDPAPHYEHSEIGYNYRMSNVLAAIGRGQLRVLEDRIAARRRNFDFYSRSLANLPGVMFQPEATWGRHTRWLTALTIDPVAFGADRETVRLALERENIEARPLWKPMHLQPVFKEFECVGGAVAEELFAQGLCLPSGSSLSTDELERVAETIRRVYDTG
jgi:dTDP-4-amino-4,6-dideoxygalactose transaminase